MQYISFLFLYFPKNVEVLNNTIFCEFGLQSYKDMGRVETRTEDRHVSGAMDMLCTMLHERAKGEIPVFWPRHTCGGNMAKRT